MTLILTIHTTTRQIIDNQLTIKKECDTLKLTSNGVVSTVSFYPYTNIIDVSTRRMTKYTFALYIHTDEGVKTFLADHDPTAFSQTLKQKITHE